VTSAPTPSVLEALRAAASLGIDRLDAQVLLLHLLGRPSGDRAWLITHDDEALPDPVARDFAALCERRLAGEPVAYLVGHKEFHGLTFRVDARVLVPRPDTETLVEWALAVLEGVTTPRVLDLGTGSGAIALALQRQRPDAEVLAIDASEEALAVARANATRLGLPVRFAHGHWLDGIDARFDLIVSNPPYIAENDAHLPALRHEPRQALVSGPDGLQDLRLLCAQVPARLAPGGWVLLEHGHDQADAVRELLRAAGLQGIQSRRDLAGIERCSGARRAALG
jgi:release factor glutamine methyltransferase